MVPKLFMRCSWDSRTPVHLEPRSKTHACGRRLGSVAIKNCQSIAFEISVKNIDGALSARSYSDISIGITGLPVFANEHKATSGILGATLCVSYYGSLGKDIILVGSSSEGYLMLRAHHSVMLLVWKCLFIEYTEPTQLVKRHMGTLPYAVLPALALSCITLQCFASTPQHCECSCFRKHNGIHSAACRWGIEASIWDIKIKLYSTRAYNHLFAQFCSRFKVKAVKSWHD